jgi:hypothetical protein
MDERKASGKREAEGDHCSCTEHQDVEPTGVVPGKFGNIKYINEQAKMQGGK